MQFMNEWVLLALMLTGGVVCLLLRNRNRDRRCEDALPKDPFAGLLVDQGEDDEI